MADGKSLKQKYLDGDKIHTVRISMASTEEDVARIIGEEPCDMIYIDSQHGPHTEWDIKRISVAAEEHGVGVQLRIKHTRHTYLIGNYLDLGPLCIKVPEVEERSVVEDAIENFYFPPLGRRSWGGRVGFGAQAHVGDDGIDRRSYAKWWNENGVLGFKVESIKAALTIRDLILPEITYIDFGGEDLSFDLECTGHPHLQTVADCRAFVKRELEGSHVRIM